MSRKIRRVPYRLDPAGIKELPHNEIVAILRGADELIMSGGRSLLAKILKGSRAKRVLELELDLCPVYGFYKRLTFRASKFDMSYLKDRNRGMILLLLDKVEESGDPKYIPLLKAWEEIDYKKVQKRIRQVITNLVEVKT